VLTIDSARLTLDDALPHLYHFCNLLGSGPFVDTRPQFKFTINPSNLVTAKVILPISIDPAVRTASSLESWRTERLASKDAAFEAYKALYHAGLINQNLLPVRDETDEQAAEFQIPDNMPSIVPTSPTFDPWPNVARAQQENPQAYERTMLEITAPGEKTLRMLFLTPVPLPNIAEFILHWNKTKRYTVKKSCLTAVILTMEELNTMRSITWKILYSIYSGRMQHNRPDFLWLLAPCDESGCALDLNRLSNWNSIITGSRPASALITAGEITLEDWGLISKYGDNIKYIPNSIVTGPSLAFQSELQETQLQMTRVPRRRDFLHPVVGIINVNDAYIRLEKFPASECIVERLPASYSVFALFFPSILHKVEVSLVAETLRNTLLAPVSIESTHLPLIVKALTSSAADEDENYQRLEFLGDCLLKFIATVHLMADNLTWPESYLTGKKGKIVSNGFLARATLAAGLDKFVITKRFTGAKWSPRYAGDVLRDPPSSEKKERSSKLIADVVESLIGTSYVIGGFAKAFSCVCTLLPLEDWTPIPKANSILYYAVPEDGNIAGLTVLQNLIGRRFNKKSLLLDALTHASYQGTNAQSSYERMEFLGDAVLDYIVSRRLYAHRPALSHRKMHAMRTAMANASFLAFRMFETTVVEETFDKATMQPEAHERALWQFLRSGASNLVEARDVARRRHEEARVRIASALDEDAEFPWHLLALTDAPKFLSDIVESVIGAIYIDSHGDVLACEDFVRRLGILDCLERILRDDVDCLHPKERLGHLAVEKRVQYMHIVDDKDARTTYRCQVRVGEETVGEVVSGLKRLNAETIAAQRANKILMRTKDVVRHGALDDDVFFDAYEGGGMLEE
jgi:dsRNA-specific ribonuclease